MNNTKHFWDDVICSDEIKINVLKIDGKEIIRMKQNTELQEKYLKATVKNLKLFFVKGYCVN